MGLGLWRFALREGAYGGLRRCAANPPYKTQAHVFTILVLIKILLAGDSAMETTIRKWGKGPAVLLTTSMMKAADFDVEQKVVIKASKGRIVIESTKTSGYTLEALVSGINGHNLHEPADFGDPVGRELM